MAADYVRMGCAEIKYMTLPHVSEEAASNNSLLVVGGGIVGMTAAIEAAAAGYPVTLVEKGGVLGGSAHDEYKRIPESMPYADPEDTGVADMVAKVEADSKITVHLNSTTHQDQRCTGSFLGGYLHRVRFHHHGKLRRHHHGLGRA